MPLPNEIHYADTRADLIDRGKPGSRDRAIGRRYPSPRCWPPGGSSSRRPPGVARSSQGRHRPSLATGDANEPGDDSSGEHCQRHV